MDGADTVWLPVIGCHLGEKLAVADTCRGCETCCLLDTSLDFLGDIHRQFYPFLVVSDIQKGFINGDGFDKVGIFLKYLMYLMGYFCIIVMSAGHDNKIWTALLGLNDGLCRMNAPFSSFIAGCRNHTAGTVEAYRYGFAPQFGIVSLFYRCKESIHVDMYNLPFFHCLYVLHFLLIVCFICCKNTNYFFLMQIFSFILINIRSSAGNYVSLNDFLYLMK